MAVRIPIGVSVCESIRDAVRDAVRGTIDKRICLSICSNSFLHSLPPEGWSNSSWFSLRRYQIVGNVLDEEAFSLLDHEFPANVKQCFPKAIKPE